MLDVIKLLNRSVCSAKVCGLVISSHANDVIALYKNPLVRALSVKAIEVVSQNLALLFHDPKFVFRVLSESPIFVEWSQYLDVDSAAELEKREFNISKMGKSLIHLAADPDCHLLIMQFFVQKFLDMVNRCADVHMQREVRTVSDRYRV